jgi:hypothetical protein
MRGDFSSWRDEHKQNFVGVLHQQGRVLLDADWNAQTELANDWQDTAGMDIIGAGVAAIPSDQANGFQITGAEVKTSDRVELTVTPGRVWADGLLYRLDGPDTGVKRTALYLAPPIQDPTAGFPTIASTPVTRDAVILEVWREELSAFQLPELLFEPALGDPDTTERILTSAAFRLFRLEADDTCDSIIDRLKDSFDDKGKLTVTLQPVVPSGTPDCPLVAGGGYTGFEHNLYRIEIANVDINTPMFKWSQYNGGIVGRGKFDSAVNPKTVAIHANLQAIINSGLTSCYLEALEFDPSPLGNLGRWRVSYGAKATVGSDGVITLNNAPAFGDVPTSSDDVFFRLWNGIELISDFSGGLVALQDGILLDFDAVAPGKYTPRDYWTFSVRAGEIKNNPPLIANQPPQGIHYHRVPLVELTWNSNPIASVDIEDCRRVFQPLTKVATCCTYRVGDGVHSHGDFTKIQEAINHLPANGGEICVLPGNYEENVWINAKRNITIKGCGTRSRVVSSQRGDLLHAAPVIQVIGSQNIKIQSLLLEADDTGVGILIEGAIRGLFSRRMPAFPTLDITLENLLVRAATRSAIEVQVAYNVTIRRCRIEMRDVPSARPGIFFMGEDSLIEENVIVVADTKRRIGGFDFINPLDPDLATRAHAALGGLQLGGTCERIRVINNVIPRGIGNGITLGSLRTIDGNGRPLPEEPEPEPDPCDPCHPGDSSIPPGNDGGTRTVSAGDLYEILIERNRIFNMGLNGIGVVGFFDIRSAAGTPQLITVNGLHILGNEISRCLSRPLADISAKLQTFMGYGSISLASVLDLIVRDNFIEDNGPDYRQPVCGIFLLHGEGVDISRNLIQNNGARTEEPATSAKAGPRGGIFIASCLAPSDRLPQKISRQGMTLSNGVPALKVHENVVSAPLGRALTVLALGPVSVVGNQFTSREIEESQVKIATVLIVNIGHAIDDSSKLKSFQALNKGQQDTANPAVTNTTGIVNAAPPAAVTTAAAVSIPRQLINGSVLFTNNQCMLQSVEVRGVLLAATGRVGSFDFGASVAIVTLDDIGFHDNQCECLHAQARLLTDVSLLGLMSVRASDNRFKEILRRVAFSAITLGRLNTTTDNQATHCLLIAGPLATKVNTPNTVLNQVAECRRFNELFQKLFG